MPAASAEQMPTLCLGHGAPPLADDALWASQLSAWAGDLPRPRAILMISAHWQEAPLALGAAFWGFDQHYYEVPSAPACADSVRQTAARREYAGTGAP